MSDGLLERSPECKFHDTEDRLNFVRKVYSIVGAQLILTTAVTAVPLAS